MLSNMSIGTMLLICFILAELGGTWAQERTGLRPAPPAGRARTSVSPRRTRSIPGLLAEPGWARTEMLGAGLDIDTLPNNMTHIVEDSHRYYTWRSFGPADKHTEDLWVDLNDPRLSQVRMHGILSNTHRQAARVALSFDFPFYGHYLRQITIATGGFIFTGDVVHRVLTATQYIAPLMANFDPSFSRESTVQYMDNGKVFVVQWDRVRLQGREHDGAFTFQTVLHHSGAIVFNYRDVPLPVEVISSTLHPVKVGLSDAFMALLPSQQTPGAHRRTIYEYHRVEVDTTKIANHTAFEFTPLPTCLQHETCELCLTSNLTSGCSWCNVLQRCSDGIDRHRQEWLDHACSNEKAEDLTCQDYSMDGEDDLPEGLSPSGPGATPTHGAFPEGPVTEDDTKHLIRYSGNGQKPGPPEQQGAPVHTGVIAGVVSAVVLLLAFAVLVLYINSHPAASPPLYLLPRRGKYWPSMKFRNQNGRSAYAEVDVGGHEKEGFIEAEQY
ncbi:plexin domain-containing protein 1-like isoform X1 [Paramormyrops kingsleyae]|uniref:Plexin domain containing 1 n=3 Tax=Paramormyrops kingsleyae TaxID=1676925 RepID=A0A3B3QGA0_9TELE|nr:plexin domain-containing protein 1-like isoform X1 [Paramormyrops kingsleyae]